jgi:hypothetical protein
VDDAVERMTERLEGACVSKPSDLIEHACTGRGTLIYTVDGPELDGQAFSNFFKAAHANVKVAGKAKW